MKFSIRTGLKIITPVTLIRWVRRIQVLLKKKEIPETKSIFLHAPRSPEYLGSRELQELQKKYLFLPDYGYDPQSTNRRGAQRAKAILRFPGASRAHSFLELGCWDGMVSYHLHRFGKQTTAVDLRSDGFDERARRGGVSLIQMNAEDLRFDDASFDFVFSYDTFEHVSHPEIVLENSLRVLKPGGSLFLAFGPLYGSPFGQHAYRSISVPYCHLLFPQELLNDFASSQGRNPIHFGHVNGWLVDRYRKLWQEYVPVLRRIRYSESLNLAHLSLVRQYPSCFRSKIEDFEDLIVESISVLFEKVQ